MPAITAPKKGNTIIYVPNSREECQEQQVAFVTNVNLNLNINCASLPDSLTHTVLHKHNIEHQTTAQPGDAFWMYPS